MLKNSQYYESQCILTLFCWLVGLNVSVDAKRIYIPGVRSNQFACATLGCLYSEQVDVLTETFYNGLIVHAHSQVDGWYLVVYHLFGHQAVKNWNIKYTIRSQVMFIKNIKCWYDKSLFHVLFSILLLWLLLNAYVLWIYAYFGLMSRVF